MANRNILRLWTSALKDASNFLDLVSGETLALRPATDNVGTIAIGDGTYSIDFKWFGNSTSNYALFDVSADALQLDGVDLLVGDLDLVIFGDDRDLVMQWDGSTGAVTAGNSGMWVGCPSKADPRFDTVATEIFDDFNKAASATASNVHTWATVDDSGTGTNAFQAVLGGVFNVVTAAQDNDYHTMTSDDKVFQLTTGKKCWFEARFKVAEATVNDCAWVFGITDTTTTGGLQADDAGPLASYDGCLIWKKENTMEVYCETSNAGVQDTTAAIATFVTNTWTTVGFYFDGSTTITPYVDGVAKEAVTHDPASQAAGYLVFGIKAGPGAAAETLQVDYVRCVQLR